MLDMVNGGISVDNALELNQTTFGSVCYRNWVEFNTSKNKFVLSPRGKELYSINRNLDLHRATNNGRFGVRVESAGIRRLSRNEVKRIRGHAKGKGITAARKDAMERAERREAERDQERDQERGRLEAAHDFVEAQH